MNSRLYSGQLRHRRTSPKRYQFTYGVYYLELDLDEIDTAARRILPLSRNRFNMLSFFDRDHMTTADSDRALASPPHSECGAGVPARRVAVEACASPVPAPGTGGTAVPGRECPVAPTSADSSSNAGRGKSGAATAPPGAAAAPGAGGMAVPGRESPAAPSDRDHITGAESARALASSEHEHGACGAGVPACASPAAPSMAHPDSSTSDLRTVVRDHLAARGIDPDSVRITLLTTARVLGYVFNPVSFYFVRNRSDNALRNVIAEVHNTHGERHIYDLDRIAGAATYTARASKAFYVSPFIDMDARYEFDFRESAVGDYDIRLDEYQGDALFFQAQLVLSPRPLTNANVAHMLARYPLVTLKTIALIHWQGLKLWLRGVKYRPWTSREAPP